MKVNKETLKNIEKLKVYLSKQETKQLDTNKQPNKEKNIFNVNGLN